MEKERNLHEINQYMDDAFPVGIYTVTREGILPEGRGYQDLHWHEELQFTYVVSGRLQMRVDGKEYVVNENEAIFINRNLLHITTDLSEDGKYISLNFTDRILGFFSGSRMEQDMVFPYTKGYRFPAAVLKAEEMWQKEVLEILKKILEILKADEKEEDFQYHVAILITSLWYEMLHNMKDKLVVPKKSYVRKQERIQKMLGYLHENYMQDVKLDDIAHAANVSVGECCRCFREMVGVTPNRYLAEYRIERSRELLSEATLSVTEVAYAVGFNDSSYFIQFFRKCTGMTPGEYQKC